MSWSEITELLGAEDAGKLSDAFGGMELLITNNTNSIHRIAAVIGIEKAQIFCARFSGGMLYFQKMHRSKSDVRNKEIIEAYTNGARVDDLAMKYGVSARQIWYILKKTP